MYHNQQPTDGRSPSILENNLTTSYTLADVVSSTTNFNVMDVAYGNKKDVATTGSAYLHNPGSPGIQYLLKDSDDDLIDEVGEAEDDRRAVGIEEEDSLYLEGLDLTLLYLGNEEDYTTLELPPQEMYMNSLFETDVEVTPYLQNSRVDATNILYTVSYYDGLGVEAITEPEQGSDSDELIFSAESTSTTEDLDEDPNLDLESRVGFRN